MWFVRLVGGLQESKEEEREAEYMGAGQGREREEDGLLMDGSILHVPFEPCLSPTSPQSSPVGLVAAEPAVLCLRVACTAR